MSEVLNNDKVKKSERLYFPELDGLRFFAFFLVFLHHHSLLKGIPVLSILKTKGWIGVDLFFALSAYLFTKLLIVEHEKTKTISFKKFYLRRIFRIWPIYFLYIGISIIIHIASVGEIDSDIWVRIIGLFTFSDNIMTALYSWNPLPHIGHLWTITYEEQFYIFIPLIILLLVRSSQKVKSITLISVFVLFTAIKIVLIADNVPHYVIWVLPITHFESIILGIAIGFGGFDFILKKIKPPFIGLLGLLFFILLCATPGIFTVSYWLVASYLFIGLATSLLLFSVLHNNALKKFFSHKVFVFLGKRSYGLYVYHMLANGLTPYLLANSTFLPWNTVASFIYSLTFTIIISVLSYKYIETPFLKLKKKFEVIITRPI